MVAEPVTASALESVLLFIWSVPPDKVSVPVPRRSRLPSPNRYQACPVDGRATGEVLAPFNVSVPVPVLTKARMPVPLSLIVPPKVVLVFSAPTLRVVSDDAVSF